ncbi:hypothetical protein BD779DRAFT_656940 [Infundibulicybe gibba]|nr:hypothetical protein BD779DRAFT_656940 [Infundibulicybe gibba]
MPFNFSLKLLNLPILRYIMNPTPSANIDPEQLFYGPRTLSKKTLVGSWAFIAHGLLLGGTVTLTDLYEMHLVSIRCMKQRGGAQHEYLIIEVWSGSLGRVVWLRTERFAGDESSGANPVPADLPQGHIDGVFDSLEAAIIGGASGETVDLHHTSTGPSDPIIALDHISPDGDLGVSFGSPSIPALAPIPGSPSVSGRDGGRAPRASPTPIMGPRYRSPHKPSGFFVSISDQALEISDECFSKETVAKDIYSLTGKPSDSEHSHAAEVFFMVFDSNRCPNLIDLFSIIVAISRMKDNYRVVTSNCYFFSMATIKYFMENWPTSQHSDTSRGWLDEWHGRAVEIDDWRKRCNESFEASRTLNGRISNIVPPLQMSHYGFINFSQKIAIDLGRLDGRVKLVKQEMVAMFERAGRHAQNAIQYESAVQRALELEEENKKLKAEIAKQYRRGGTHS